MGTETIALLLIAIAVLAFIMVVPRRLRSWTAVTTPPDEDVEWSAHMDAGGNRGSVAVDKQRATHTDVEPTNNAPVKRA